MIEISKDTGVFRFKRFDMSDDQHVLEYEMIMNDFDTRVQNEERYFDKHGNYFVALHWIKQCTKDERKQFLESNKNKLKK